MKLRTEHEAGRMLFIDVDAADKEVYLLPESGGSVPDDTREIVTEFELVGEIMTADVTEGGSGWNSQMIERLERRRTELKNALMEQYKKEIQNDRK